MAFRKASTIEVPEVLFRTIKTGAPEIDYSFSELGGVVPSQVVFVTGKPGAGKTTLTLVVSSRMQVTAKNPGAFISLEMSDFQLALSRKKIPGFDMMWIDTEFSLERTINELRRLKPSSVTLDSIQKAASLMEKQGEAVNFNQAQKEIVSEFYKFSKETFIPVFLIGHMSKSGSYIGPSHLEHEVDSHLKVEYDQELDMRTFHFGKNRFGGKNDNQMFGITSSGIWLGSPYSTFEESDREQEQDPKYDDHKLAAERVSNIISRFKEASKDRELIPSSDVQTVTREVVNYLKLIDKETIAKNSYIRDVSKIKLTYDFNGVAQCASRKGELRFGKQMSMVGFQIGKIGYRKEQPFIVRNCKSREDLFIWVIIHEWIHLYQGMQHHKIAFFQQVEALWKKFHASLFQAEATV
jgi:hypothetical protein